MKYCCSDLHGCFNEFIKLLKKINFSGNDTMYVLGDNIDRGHQSIELLKYIFEHDNIVSLIGNHEEFLLDYIDKGFNDSNTSLWDENDGEITRRAINKLGKDDPVLFKKIIENIKTCDSCIILKPYILSHAGYNAAKLKNMAPTIESLGKMTHDDFIWSREDFFKCKGIDDHITMLITLEPVFQTAKKRRNCESRRDNYALTYKNTAFPIKIVSFTRFFKKNYILQYT